MLFTDIVLIYVALMLVRFGWLWTMKKFSLRFLKKKPMEFGSWTTREILIASFAGVRGAITLAGVLSIPLLLPDGSGFPARYELIFLAAGVILFSLFVGVVMLPILLQHLEVADHSLLHPAARSSRHPDRRSSQPAGRLSRQIQRPSAQRRDSAGETG